MNGEFSELFDAIKKFSNEVHNQRHQENLQKFEKLFDKLDKLPCDERKGVYGSIRKQLNIHWILITIILIAILGAALK